jgi:hypothetical protein
MKVRSAIQSWEPGDRAANLNRTAAEETADLRRRVEAGELTLEEEYKAYQAIAGKLIRRQKRYIHTLRAQKSQLEYRLRHALDGNMGALIDRTLKENVN